jgi:hypothetical protein
MLELVAIGFVAGVVCGISPCILLVLPVILVTGATAPKIAASRSEAVAAPRDAVASPRDAVASRAAPGPAATSGGAATFPPLRQGEVTARRRPGGSGETTPGRSRSSPGW